MKGFATAWRLLTSIPMFGGHLDQTHKAMIWFPLVGLILGFFSFRLIYPLSGLFSPQVTALLLVLFQAWITRGLHLDGLADLCDGLYSNGSQVKMLEVMKDPRLGTFGVLALVFLILVKWQFLALVLTFESSFVILALLGSMMLSRFAQGWMAARFNYAREEGKGKGFIAAATNRDGVKLLGVSCLLIFFLNQQLLLLLLVTLLFVEFFGRFLRQKLGGITGDCLGATSEITEVLILFSVILLQQLQFLHPSFYEYLTW